MNITHIMAQTMYTQDMYMLINTCFDGTEHKFCTGHAKRKDSLAPIGLNQAKGNAEVINPKHFIRYIKNYLISNILFLFPVKRNGWKRHAG